MLDAETKDYLDEKVDTFAEMVQEGFADMGQRIDRVEKKVDHLEEKVDNLDVKVDKLETKVDKLEVKVGQGFDQLDGFIKHLDRNDQEIVAAHGGLQRHEVRITALEAHKT